MHGQLEAPRCSAGINQPDTPSKVSETTTTHDYHHQITFKKRHGNTKVKVSSTPIPKDLPPLLRARAVALSGKSVGLTLGENANVTELDWRKLSEEVGDKRVEPILLLPFTKIMQNIHFQHVLHLWIHILKSILRELLANALNVIFYIITRKEGNSILYVTKTVCDTCGLINSQQSPNFNPETFKDSTGLSTTQGLA